MACFHEMGFLTFLLLILDQMTRLSFFLYFSSFLSSLVSVTTKRRTISVWLCGLWFRLELIVSFLTLLSSYILRQQRKRTDTFGSYDEGGLSGSFSWHNIFRCKIWNSLWDFLICRVSENWCESETIYFRDATSDFSLNNKLGDGGFGPVYKEIFSFY